MTADLLETMRELDSRRSDGILVRLLWCASENRVAVSVADAKSGDALAGRLTRSCSAALP